jgi:hypothetical protein
MSRNLMTRKICVAASNVLLLLAFTSARAVPGQAMATQPLLPVRQSPSDRAIGEITSVDPGSGSAIIRTDAGQFITLSFGVNARFLRVPPGDTSLSRAAETTIAGLTVGDRVSARGLASLDKTRLAVETVIVMSRAEIRKKQEQDKQEWASRSVAGLVRELKPETGEIILEVYGSSGSARIVVQTAGCKFRRYSADSVKFSDSIPGRFSDLRTGDQLRALGEKTSSGAGWKAAEIIFGSFQTIGGVVTGIDARTGEIKITILGQKREAAVAITPDSVLKRISPQAAMIIAQRAAGLRQGPPPAPGGQKQPVASGLKSASAPSAPAPQLPDSQQIIDSMPDMPLSDLKPGDVVAVTSAAGDTNRITAIKMVAGVDVVINAINARSGQRQVVALSAGLPLGIFDYGISRP